VNTKQNKNGMNRRELLTGTGAVSAGLLISAAMPNSASANSHMGGHGDHMMHNSNTPKRMPVNMPLILSAQNCLTSANICVSHCLILIGQGDNSLQECLRTASEMIPSCNGLGQLASMNAKHLKKYAEYCITVCTDCEIECRKHQDHHWQCKNCAQACAECIRQCKMLIAA
jgi:Cys-rich four helix bundle protein (predicted Tat secretion target)